MLLVAFLKPPGEQCWVFCLWYPAPDLAAPLQRCFCWAAAAALLQHRVQLPGHQGAQREQPSGYSLHYNGFQTLKGLKMFRRVVFPAFSPALGFLLCFSGAVSRLLLPSLISPSASRGLCQPHQEMQCRVVALSCPCGGYRAPSHRGGFAFAGKITKQLFRQAVLPGRSLGRGITVRGWAALWGWSLQARVGVSQQKVLVFPAGSHLKKTGSIGGKERDQFTFSRTQYS